MKMPRAVYTSEQRGSAAICVSMVAECFKVRAIQNTLGPVRYVLEQCGEIISDTDVQPTPEKFRFMIEGLVATMIHTDL